MKFQSIGHQYASREHLNTKHLIVSSSRTSHFTLHTNNDRYHQLSQTSHCAVHHSPISTTLMHLAPHPSARLNFPKRTMLWTTECTGTRRPAKRPSAFTHLAYALYSIRHWTRSYCMRQVEVCNVAARRPCGCLLNAGMQFGMEGPDGG